MSKKSIKHSTKKPLKYIILSLALVLILLTAFFYKSWMVLIETGSKYQSKMVLNRGNTDTEDNSDGKYIARSDEEIVSTEELRKDPNWKKITVEKGSIAFYFLEVLERELFPTLQWGKPCVDTFYALGFEKKINMMNTLKYEVVDFTGPHKEESVRRMVDSIHECAELSKSTLVKIFAFSFPTILRIMRYKLDIKGIFALIRVYSTSKEKNFLKKKDKLTRGKSLLSNPHLEKLDAGSDGAPISFFKAVKIPSFDSGTEVKTPILFPNYPSDNGEMNGTKYLDWIKEKLQNVIKETHPKENPLKKSNGELSGIVSVLKAHSMNKNTKLDSSIFKDIIFDHQNKNIKLPEFKDKIHNIFKNQKIGKAKLTDKFLKNYTALFHIILTKSKFLRSVPLLPKDLVEQYPDLGLQVKSCKTPDECIAEIKKYLINPTEKPIVPTVVLFLENDPQNNTPNNIHYANVVHYDNKKKEFVLDDSQGALYTVTENDLKKLMKFNMRKTIKNSFSKFDRLLLDEITWDFREGFYENLVIESERYIYERVGGDYVIIVPKKN